MRLHVYDLLGRRVADLVDAEVAAGWHDVALAVSRLQSGAYVYPLETPGVRRPVG